MMQTLPKSPQIAKADLIRRKIPQKLINRYKHFPLAVLANIFYGFPSKKLKVIGVTGTDGKTTTVNLIYNILFCAGFKTGMISTVSAMIGAEELDTGFHVTAPDPWLLQSLLKKMVDHGLDSVVIEATSHGLDQYRLWGVNFDIGVLTNITHEHLDYHKTFENYQISKLNLFLNSKVSILNKDDSSYKFFSSIIKKNPNKKIVSYAVKNNADVTIKKFPFKSMLLGEFNKYNCLASIAVALELGVNKEIILKAVESFSGVSGRLDEINEGQKFKVYVDFAHTPNALQQVLTLLKKKKKPNSKLISVFGSAGLRDVSKRLMMGEISGKIADFSIITAEDPRTEDVNEICRQIAEGCEKTRGEYKIITDRQEAINFAIGKLAKKDDIVVVCGKGHEKSMCFGKTEYPWSERSCVVTSDLASTTIGFLKYPSLTPSIRE